jgi:hypothetical protein
MTQCEPQQARLLPRTRVAGRSFHPEEGGEGVKMSVRVVLAGTLLMLMTPGVSKPAIAPITSVNAGRNGAPPYELQSITVGDYTVTREFLSPGKSVATACVFTPITRADDFDLNSVATRWNWTKPVWQVTMIGGEKTWTDTNGNNPDFFIFEAGMNDSLTVQAILSGGALGQAVDISQATWGDTGLRRIGLLNLGQRIGGIAFAVTDLLDADGAHLTNLSVIEGIQINSGTVDPSSFLAVVPEPATLVLLGLGSLLMLRRRRS